MGHNVLETVGGVVARNVCLGAASGFKKAQPGYAISTAPRSNTEDYVALSRDEAIQVALSVLGNEIGNDKRHLLRAVGECLRVPMSDFSHL